LLPRDRLWASFHTQSVHTGSNRTRSDKYHFFSCATKRCEILDEARDACLLNALGAGDHATSDFNYHSAGATKNTSFVCTLNHCNPRYTWSAKLGDG
jgi:hypothetical protein